ncbi:MAG: hypothetical protein IJJ25_10060 [Lachnospiraceae bacterium]|nr:hypothetical protein [Lachnospiraceae bacterium]
MKKNRSCFIGLLLLAAVLCLTAVPGHAHAVTASISSGAARKNGLVKVKKKYYYYKNGKKVKNTWQKVKGSKYYFGKNGAAATKSKKIGKTYYVFSTKGKLLKGKGVRVKKISGKYYQVDKKGRAKSGWDKKNIYCYAKNGARIKNDWSTDKKYYLDSKGKKSKGIIVTGGLKDDGDTYVEPKFAALDETTGLVNKELTSRLNKAAKYEQDFTPLKELLEELVGKPLKTYYTDGCAGDGKDGTLVYKNFTLTTYRDTDGSEVFMGFYQDF